MNNSRFAVLLASVLMLAGSLTFAAESKSGPKLKFVTGPAKGQLGSLAQIEVPEGYLLLDAKSTQALLRQNGNHINGNEMGWLQPTNADWSIVFEFDDIGYIKDAEKEKLDADAILASIKRGNEEQNKERADAGLPPIENLAWQIPPRYNPETQNLEWAIRGTVAGKPILNYNTRLLGRKGAMEAVLLIKPDNLEETLPTFRGLLAGYSYQTGNSYAEYRPGDKIAKYGLAALIAGGAAVGAAKLGLFGSLLLLFKKAGKLILIPIVAVAAACKKFFARLFGGNKTPQA